MKSYIEQVMEAYPTWPRRVLHGEYVGVLSGVQPLLGGEAAPLYRFPGGECMGSGGEPVVRTKPIDEDGEVKCGCCGEVLLCDKYGDMPDICPRCHEGVDWSPWEDVLSSWEKDRSYWYMNYYQDSNQPLIEGENVRVFDTLEGFLSSVSDKRFRCPACGSISSNPYECNSGVASGGKKCDWKVYGLFGDMGKGCFVYIKDKVKGETIFMPVSWEEENKSANKNA